MMAGGPLSLQRWTTSTAWEGFPCTLLSPAQPLANAMGLLCQCHVLGCKGKVEGLAQRLWPTCTKKESADPPPLGASVQPTAPEMGAGCWSLQPGEDPYGSAMHGDRDKPLCPQTSYGTKKLPA